MVFVFDVVNGDLMWHGDGSKKKFGDRPSRVWSSQACICSAMLVPFTSRFSRSWCALRQADRTSLMSLQKGLPWNGAIVVIMRWFSFSPFPIHSSLLWVPQHDLKSLMAVLPQRAVHLGSKPLQRQGHQNSPWNIQDQGTVWLQYDYSQWTLETVQVHLEATFQPIFQQPQLPLHRAEAALRFAPVLRMVHAAQNAVVYGVYGPTAPPIATCMISDGENDDEPISRYPISLWPNLWSHIKMHHWVLTYAMPGTFKPTQPVSQALQTCKRIP